MDTAMKNKLHLVSCLAFRVLLLSPVLFALSAVAAPNFDAARREAVKIVKDQVALERNDRKKAEDAFVFGMREGGATFGLGQTPSKVKSDPRIDAKVMAKAYGLLRAALPEKLSPADEAKILLAELDLELAGGDYASREKVYDKLMTRPDDPNTVEPFLRALRYRHEHRRIIAFAEKVMAVNKGKNESLYALGLGFRWNSSKFLKDEKRAEETKKLVAELPFNAANYRNTYGILAWEASDKEEDYENAIREIAKEPVDKGIARSLYTTLYGHWDIEQVEKWYPFVVKYGDKRAANASAARRYMAHRCWKEAEHYALEAYLLKPDAESAMMLAKARFGAGMRSSAADELDVILVDEKQSVKAKFIAKVMRVVSEAATPEEVPQAILALEKESGAKDGREFAEFLIAASAELFTPLSTKENAPWLFAIRKAMMSLAWEEERVEHTAKFIESAPRTAAAAEAAGLFDGGRFAKYVPETRFGKFRTYTWEDKSGLLGNLKCNEKPDLHGVKGEGVSAAILVVYDLAGVHYYSRFEDPAAAKYKFGETKGVSMEFTIQPGEKYGWNQIFTETDAVKDKNEVLWDDTAIGRRPTFGSIVTDSTTTDTAFLFHTFVPWSHVYTRMPENGSTWGTVMCVSLPSGFFSLGGGSVHEIGRGMTVRFEIDEATAARLKKAILRRAAVDFIRFTVKWSNADRWSDPILGDPGFHAEVVKPWLDERIPKARHLVARGADEVPDAEYAELQKYLTDWFDARLVLDGLRTDYLKAKMFR